jgi:hypothetical protein
MLVVVEFLARSGGLQTALRAAIFAANVVAEVVDLGAAVDDRGYRFSADSAVAAGFVFMARNAPRSRIAALQS